MHRVTPDLIQHTQYCNRSMMSNVTQTHPQLGIGYHFLHGPVVQVVYRQPSTTLQNSTPKREGRNPGNISQEVIYHGTSPGLPQNTKSFRSCRRKEAKMLLKGQFRINCHSLYNKVIRLLQYSSPIVNGGDRGCIVRDLETIIVK